VRQGCPLSPLLYNTFMDFLCRLVMGECAAKGISGFKVAYRLGGPSQPWAAPPTGCTAALELQMLLYADDVALLAPDESSLQEALQVFATVAQAWGMALNRGKTQVMRVGAPEGEAALAVEPAEAGEPAMAAPAHAACMLAGGEPLAEVRWFKYLGSVCEGSGSQEKELNRRLALAGQAFRQLWPGVFSSRVVSLSVKVQLYRSVVLSVLLYGAAESWALTEAQMLRLAVFHTTCLRRLLGFNRLDRVENSQLFADAGIPSMEELLRAQRLRWLGHLARMPATRWAKQLLFAHEVPGAPGRGVGRPHVVWADLAKADVEARRAELGNLDWYTCAQNRMMWQRVTQCPDPGQFGN
jgi:hypothetical protein